ncbi:uncharacterized protein BX664DRAFT_355555 [Halteromyces radiatus]|uniref:uncharacterized protein n=1 Tax=Halteromyces radiatus TaxID=101107 RepID=UPI00221E3B96|nr:uncharacterized protein BX664DRAFT_355555 [Halteromyces radiatus]KAI8096147.1 hypothetical protein BX664DRAFT_355555 [Halteromyces radiatus]
MLCSILFFTVSLPAAIISYLYSSSSSIALFSFTVEPVTPKITDLIVYVPPSEILFPSPPPSPSITVDHMIYDAPTRILLLPSSPPPPPAAAHVDPFWTFHLVACSFFLTAMVQLSSSLAASSPSLPASPDVVVAPSSSSSHCHSPVLSTSVLEPSPPETPWILVEHKKKKKKRTKKSSSSHSSVVRPSSSSSSVVPASSSSSPVVRSSSSSSSSVVPASSSSSPVVRSSSSSSSSVVPASSSQAANDQDVFSGFDRNTDHMRLIQDLLATNSSQVASDEDVFAGFDRDKDHMQLIQDLLRVSSSSSSVVPVSSSPATDGQDPFADFDRNTDHMQLIQDLLKSKMMINIDDNIITFYESGPLHEMLPKLLNRRNLDDLHRAILDRECVKVEKILKNFKIVVVHLGAEKQLKYKINQGVNPLKYKNNP